MREANYMTISNKFIKRKGDFAKKIKKGVCKSCKQLLPFQLKINEKPMRTQNYIEEIFTSYTQLSNKNTLAPYQQTRTS